MRYRDFPTYISTKVKGQTEAAFPAITTCTDGSHKYRRDKLKKYGFPTRSSYNRRDKIKVRA